MCAQDDDTATGGATATNVIPFPRRPRMTVPTPPERTIPALEWCAIEAFELGWRAGNAGEWASKAAGEANYLRWRDLAVRTVLYAHRHARSEDGMDLARAILQTARKDAFTVPSDPSPDAGPDR